MRNKRYAHLTIEEIAVGRNVEQNYILDGKKVRLQAEIVLPTAAEKYSDRAGGSRGSNKEAFMRDMRSQVEQEIHVGIYHNGEGRRRSKEG